MTNQSQRDSRPGRMLFIDEAKYLLNGQSALHPSAFPQSPTPEEMANYVVDMLHTYAEVELTVEQRAEAIAVVRSLPNDDTTMERFVKDCSGKPLLVSLATALKKRLAEPSHLLD